VLLLGYDRSPSKEKFEETLEEILKLAWEDSEAGHECRKELDARVDPLRQMDPREYWKVRELMVLEEVVDFLREHPGSLCKDEGGYRASRPFRRFVLKLSEPGHSGSVLTVEQLSDVTGVPLPMLQSWLRKKAKGRKRHKR
jgi:hypothetical protein